MGKIFTYFIVFVIVLIGLYFLLFKAGEKVFDEHTAPLKELVGEQVVINKDTLEVVDYTSWNKTVTLDDTRTISVEYAKKNLIKVD